MSYVNSSKANPPSQKISGEIHLCLLTVAASPRRDGSQITTQLPGGRSDLRQRSAMTALDPRLLRPFMSPVSRSSRDSARWEMIKTDMGPLLEKTAIQRRSRVLRPISRSLTYLALVVLAIGCGVTTSWSQPSPTTVHVSERNSGVINIAGAAQPQSQAAAVSGIQHITWVWFENKEYTATPAVDVNADPSTYTNPNTYAASTTHPDTVAFVTGSPTAACLSVCERNRVFVRSCAPRFKANVMFFSREQLARPSHAGSEFSANERSHR